MTHIVYAPKPKPPPKPAPLPPHVVDDSGGIGDWVVKVCAGCVAVLGWWLWLWVCAHAGR